MLLIGYCLFTYFAGGLAMTLGYHRCLSHRSLRLNKGLERILVTIGLPGGTPIQWSGTHRFHHLHTDGPFDPHSPFHGGFWHAHVGWYLGTSNPWICLLYSLAGPLRTLFDGWHRPRTNQQHVHLARDVAADPYYRFMSKPVPYLAGCVFIVIVFYGGAYAVGQGAGLLATWAVQIVIYNLGDGLNSFGHLCGDQPFDSPHRARNSLLGLLTLGEGWHANHHEFPYSARHGLSPAQIDGTWYVILMLERMKLASNIKVVDQQRLRKSLVRAAEAGKVPDKS